MDIIDFLNDKSIKPKDKTEKISKLLVSKELSVDKLMGFMGKAKDPVRATCIEALEYASKENPAIINRSCFDFVVNCLSEKAPRIKWEAARVIGNVAHLYPDGLALAVKNLLTNAGHSGTVVRWSAAFAVGEIIKLRTAVNNTLIPAVNEIIEKEEKNSITKIYIDAIKKSEK